MRWTTWRANGQCNIWQALPLKLTSFKGSPIFCAADAMLKLITPPSSNTGVITRACA